MLINKQKIVVHVTEEHIKEFQKGEGRNWPCPIDRALRDHGAYGTFVGYEYYEFYRGSDGKKIIGYFPAQVATKITDLDRGKKVKPFDVEFEYD